jgi:DNA-binding IclR family transcriptional regulator
MILSTEKMLDIVDLLSKETKFFSVAEISSRLGISSNSVFRVLKELEGKQFIERNPQDSSYQLTNKLYYLGRSIGNRVTLTGIAQRSMERLHELTRETVLLSQLGTTGSTLLLGQLDSPESVKFISNVGEEYFSRSSALGKAMLAFSDPKLVEAFAA